MNQLVLKALWMVVKLLLSVVWELIRAVLPFGDSLPTAFPDKDKGDAGAQDPLDPMAGRPAPGGATRRRPAARSRPVDTDAEEMRRRQLETRLDRLETLTRGDDRVARLLPTIAALRSQASVERAQGDAHPVRDGALDASDLDDALRLTVYLERMARQRLGEDLGVLADADAAADACFAPLLSFLDAEDIPHHIGTPTVLFGDWPLSIDLSFLHLPIAPVRLPDAFRSSVYLWPALAHEVAHDVYFGVEGLEDELFETLSLPDALAAPLEPQDYVEVPPEYLMGPWLPEVFADLLGVLQMGPAYAIAMARLFAEPDRPEATRAAGVQQGLIAPHPPADLRIRLAAELLIILGRAAEAQALMDGWTRVHGETERYYMPTADGRYAGLARDYLLDPAVATVHALMEEQWHTLSGHGLMDIPGLSYLHAEHAQVLRQVPHLSDARSVRAEPRLVVAAAVLAVEAGAPQPRVMSALRGSIAGVGESARTRLTAASTGMLEGSAHDPRHAVAAGSIAAELRATLQSPAALTEAVLLGEGLRPRRERS